MTRHALRCGMVFCALCIAACATPAGEDTFDAFLRRIAVQCKPLIIGADDMGQAILFNGVGAMPEHYNTFIAKTQALYGGGISQQVYRDSLVAFVGAGSYNTRSVDCIVAHLPPREQTSASPAK